MASTSMTSSRRASDQSPVPPSPGVASRRPGGVWAGYHPEEFTMLASIALGEALVVALFLLVLILIARSL
jgi:hypothetical protein